MGGCGGTRLAGGSPQCGTLAGPFRSISSGFLVVVCRHLLVERRPARKQSKGSTWGLKLEGIDRNVIFRDTELKRMARPKIFLPPLERA